MKKYAIIAAGGSGSRMGQAIPKQFLLVAGKPVLWHTVKIFRECFDDIEVVVVAPADFLTQSREICEAFGNIHFTEGGSSRFQSVKKGLSHVQEQSIVFVHDAVRCLVTKDLLQRCYAQAVEKGSAIPAIPVNDSLRIKDAMSHRVIDRNNILIIQTPQTFRSEILLPAFEADDQPQFTDEATVVEASGQGVHLVEGEHTNIKITRPLDLLIAEAILREQSSLK